MKRLLLLVAMVAALGVLCGCRSFESDWNAATAPTGLTGRWVGTWQNTNNTHSGPLRAVITQQDTNHFSARFHAGWGKRSGSFKTKLAGHWHAETFEFTGKRRILGVPIRTTGTATATRLDSGYDSPFDQGTFTLRRE